TMSTLWNSGSAPEDLIVTIGFNGGDGHYKLPVHLEPGAGKAIDLAEIIRAAKPDADGHLIPHNVQGGGMIISGSSGLPEKINVVVSGGVFSVFGATCVPPCVTCGPPPSELVLTPASLSVAVGGSQQVTSTIEYSNGQSFSDTSSTTWTSKNTSVATVSSGGMMNAMAVGSTDIDGQDEFLRSDRICSWTGPYICPTVFLLGEAPTNVKPVITSISPDTVTVGSTVTLTIEGAGFGSSPTVNLPIGVTSTGSQASTNSQILIGVTVLTSAPIGANSVTVTAGSQISNAAAFTLDGPYYMTVVSDSIRTCSGCTKTVARFVTYQVKYLSNSDAGAIPIGENPVNSGWNCSQSNPG